MTTTQKVRNVPKVADREDHIVSPVKRAVSDEIDGVDDMLESCADNDSSFFNTLARADGTTPAPENKQYLENKD